MPRVSIENLKDIDPLSAYRLSDIDSGGVAEYYGYVATGGGWYILKLTSTEARYCKGDKDYITNWGNRDTSLVYGYFNNVF